MRLAIAVLASVAALPAAAEPRIHLKLPGHPGSEFANFAAVSVPAEYGVLEIWLEDALAEIQVSTIRVVLNETPMTPFVALNPLPRGFRAIIRPGATASADYMLRPQGENILSVTAQDETKVTYRGQFQIGIDAKATAPRVAPVRAGAAPRAVQAPPSHRPPQIALTSVWPARTAESFLTLDAEVTDGEGLRRVVIEVNGKDYEEVVIENELPVRQRNGFGTHARLPGQVLGDSRRLQISVPVKLGKDITVVAVRAENAIGLRSRADATVQRLRK